MEITGFGHHVELQATDHRHYGHPVKDSREAKGDLVNTFGNMLSSALREVNGKQVHADNLTIKAGTDPDTVNVHELMDAVAQANMSLNLTKAVTERGVRAYQQIINMR